MSRVEVIGDATLYLGDCLEVLPTLPKVDAVITDPPYPREFLHVWEPFAKASFAITKDGGELVTLLGHWQMPEVIGAFAASEWRYWWVCGMRQTNRVRLPGKWVNVYFKPALWYVKGKKQLHSDIPSDLVLGSVPDKDTHAWEQGVDWFRHWVERTTEKGEIVLDPFSGTATTGIAAIQSGRKFIGVELDEVHFSNSCRRIEQAYKQRPLFEAEPQRNPEQLGLESA